MRGSTAHREGTKHSRTKETGSQLAHLIIGHIGSCHYPPTVSSPRLGQMPNEDVLCNIRAQSAVNSAHLRQAALSHLQSALLRAATAFTTSQSAHIH